MVLVSVYHTKYPIKTTIQFHDTKERLCSVRKLSVTINWVKEDALQMVVDQSDGTNGKFWNFLYFTAFYWKGNKVEA